MVKPAPSKATITVNLFVQISNDAESIKNTIKVKRASMGLISHVIKGLSLVLSTFPSISLSK